MQYRERAFDPKFKQVLIQRDSVHSRAVNKTLGLMGKPNVNSPWSDANRYPRSLSHIPGSLLSEGLRAQGEDRQS